MFRWTCGRCADCTQPGASAVKMPRHVHWLATCHDGFAMLHQTMPSVPQTHVVNEPKCGALELKVHVVVGPRDECRLELVGLHAGHLRRNKLDR